MIVSRRNWCWGHRKKTQSMKGKTTLTCAFEIWSGRNRDCTWSNNENQWTLAQRLTLETTWCLQHTVVTSQYTTTETLSTCSRIVYKRIVKLKWYEHVQRRKQRTENETRNILLHLARSRRSCARTAQQDGKMRHQEEKRVFKPQPDVNGYLERASTAP